jgi:DNA primase
VEHFAERPEYPSLQKLMATMSVGEPEIQKIEFFDALAKIEREAIVQRKEVLMAKERGSLNELEKSELRDLLSIRITPLTSGT